MKTTFTLSTKSFFLFLLYIFSAPILFAQSAYDCNSCSANDVSITSVQLLSTTPNPAYNSVTNPNVDKYLPLPMSCNDGQVLTGYLKVNISQNATTRYGLQVEGDVYVDGTLSGSFANCDPSLFVSGTRDKFYLDAAAISWTCGTKLELRKTFVGWGNSASHNACSDICGIGPHCNKPNANVSFVVITPLSANFVYTGSCPAGKTAQTYSFNALDPAHSTTGGVQPYTYSWTIIKNTVTIANLSGSNPSYDFSQAGAGSGTYTVTLTVTDSNSPATTSSKSIDINVAACCVKSAVCKLTAINQSGCSIPAALTNPSDVFTYQACGAAVTLQYSDTGDTVLCQDGNDANFTRTYKLLYDNALYASCDQQITIYDNTAPVVNAANGSSTVECLALAVAPAVPAATDNCSGTLNGVLLSTVDTPNSITCEGSRVYTYKYTDACGNVSNWTYTYTIDHTAAALVPANGASTVSCLAAAVTPTPPAVVDVCGTNITAVLASTVDSPSPLTCEGTRTYNYTYTDCSGLVSNWKYTYTIERNDFSMPQNAGSTVACAAAITAPAVPVVTDNCGNTLTPSAPVVSGTPSCEGIVTYTYTFTDCEGNNHNWVYTYTIERNDFSMPQNTGSTVACAAAITAPAVPVVTDNCGNILTPSAPAISGTPSCEGIVTYTYTFTDCEGNNHNWVYTYTIERNDFSMPSNAGSTVACAAAITAPAVPVVTDNCGNTLTPSAPVISGTPACEGNVTYTYTFTDCEGNNHNWVYTYTIERNDFSMPENASSTVACAAAITAPAVPVVTDNCGNTLTPSAPVVSGTPSCEGVVTYTYTFTDCEGNTHNWVYTYTIERNDFSMPQNAGSTVACAAAITAPAVPVVTDNCGNTLTPSAPVVSGTPSCEGIVTYTYTFTDCEGNNHNWVYTYTIEKNDFSMPSNAGSTVACAAAITAPAVPVVTDNCGNTLTPSAPVISGTPACEGNVTYTYTFTDCEGNNHNWVYTYTIERNDFSMPQNAGSTVACAAAITAPAVPVVTDNCGNTLTPSAPVVSGTPSCEGIVTYTYTFTDCEGNNHNWVYTYTIEKNDFSMPENASSIVACNASVAEPAVPVVKDNCGNTLTPSAPVISNSPSCEGNVLYTYTFTDCEGNTHNWVYTYIIETADFTMPQNAGSTVTCAAAITAPSVPQVKDNCGNTLTPSAPVISATPACEGNVTYTYTFTDCKGNKHDWIYTYTIDDTVAPTATAPQNISGLQCIADIPAANILAITDESDNCSGTVTVSVADTNNGASGCKGSPYIVTRTYTLTDCAGNSTNLVQTITVEDNTVPTFTAPANIEIFTSADCSYNASVEFTGDVTNETDNCSTGLNAAFSDAVTETCQGSKIITRTWSLVDNCGNKAEDQVQTITVSDKTAPAFTAPANTEIFTNADCSYNASVEFTGDVTNETDNCSTGLNASFSDAISEGTCQGSKIITRTWSLIDKCGNKAADQVQTITISDKTAPVWATAIGSLNTTIECSDTAALANAQAQFPVAGDNCDADVANIVKNTGQFMPNEGCANSGTYTNTWTVTDDCGNKSAVFTQVITIEDKTAPVWATAIGSLSTTIECSDTAALAMAQAQFPVAGDNCDTDVSNIVKNTGMFIPNQECANSGTYTNTWTVTDDCGNKSAAFTQVITIEDKTAPVWATAIGSLNTTIECSDTAALAMAQAQFPVAGDNCDTDVSNIVKNTGMFIPNQECANSGTYTNTWTVTDDCGNKSAAFTQVITIEDKTAPVWATAIGSLNTTIECSNAEALLAAQAQFPMAVDNCDADVANIVKNTGQFMPNESCANSGTYTNTWTVTDACGNESAEFTQIITIEDKTAPVITNCAANQTIATNENCQAIVPDFTNITVTDNCSSRESITVTQSPVAGTVIQSGTTSIMITAKDACGNISNCEAQLIVTNFIIANDDAGSPVNGYTGGLSFDNVLSNDLLNCTTATTQTVNVSFVSSTHPGITLSGTDVIVAAGTPAGSYSLVYQICEIANPQNCDTAAVSLTVTTPAIDAVADNAGPIVGVDQVTPNVINVLTNDILNGAPVVPAEVTLTTPNDNPFIHINPDGSVDVLPNAPEGPQTVTYQICEKLNPENCDSAIVTINIEKPTMQITAKPICINDVPYISYTATPGNFTPVNGLTITWADSNNNVIATMTGLSLSGQVLWPGATVDQNGNGIDWPGWIFENNMWVEKADGFEGLRPAATLTFTLNPSETIVVNYPPSDPFCTSRPKFVIDAVNDNAGPIDGINGAVNVLNVLNNDTLNNLPVVPEDITLALVTPDPTGFMTMNPDGSVDLKDGTPAGTYQLTYQICENADNGNCDTAVVSIIVTCDKAKVSGIVYNAGNNNSPIANVPITLTPITIVNGQNVISGTPIMLITNAQGYYNFTGMPAGDYVLQVQDANLNNAYGLFNTTPSFLILNVQICNYLVRDFGYDKTNDLVLGDYVWYDLNANGLQDEWYDANNDGVVTKNIPDANGAVDYSNWEWIDFNGDGSYLGQNNIGELNAAGFGNGTTNIPNLFITGPNNFAVTNTMGILGYWRVRPPMDNWGQYNAELKMESNLDAKAQAIRNSGLVKVLFSPDANTKTKASNTKTAKSNAQISTICGVTNENPQTTVLSAEKRVDLDLDFGIICKEFGATDDVYAELNCTSSGIVGNVLSNDLLNGDYIAADLVSFAVTSGSNPNITIDALGNVTVTSGIAAGTYTYTYSLCDKVNTANCVSATITIQVMDTTKPVFSQIPAATTINCPAVPVFAEVTASDTCNSEVKLTFADVTTAGNCAGSYSVTRTWTAVDQSGNSETASQTITVIDNIGPTTATQFPAQIETSCSNIPPKPELVFTDNCSAVTEPVYTAVITNQTLNHYTITREWKVSDACGNLSTFTQIVNVNIVNGGAVLQTSACNADSTPIDLNAILPEGILRSGTWINQDNIGSLRDGVFNPLDAPLGNHIFEYRITDGDCPTSIQLTMNINFGCRVLGCETVVVHNSFSPNWDGTNDKLVIDGVEDNLCYPSGIAIEIYNRWGILVFETSKYNNETNYFDGHSRGRTTIKESDGLPAGTYFYIVNYESFDGNNNIQMNKKDGFLYLSR